MNRLSRLHKIGWMLVIAAMLSWLLFCWLRAPHTSAYMRGKQIAEQLGCVGCHQPASGVAIANPSALRGIIPTFHSGASAALFWVGSEAEFAQWVRQGVSDRIRQERARFHAQPVIAMPTYGARLDDKEMSDLYGYFRDTNDFPGMPDTAIAHGAQLAREHGCFACHGAHGLDGSSNAGSFKGYIPPWEGKDFEELARDDGEIAEWIKTGSLARLERNPLAGFFLARQKIKMPAYNTILDDKQIRDLIAYIRWLPQRSQQVALVAVENKAVDGEDDIRARGDLLFTQSGCTTCHKPVGAEGFLDRNGAEIPPLPRLANKLRVLAQMIREREQMSRWSSDGLCSYYKSFSVEHDRVHRVIEQGVARDTAGKQQTVMPGWDERANADAQSFAPQAIDALVNFFIGSDDSVTGAMIAGWRQHASTCVPAQTKMVPVEDGRKQQILDRINALDSQGALFTAADSVSFLSKETALFDIIGFHADADVDFWMLRQYAPSLLPSDAQKHIREANGFPMDKRYVIAVDKRDVTYRAYFFSRDAQLDFNQPPVYITGNRFSDAGVAGCFSCHVSGPRALRPVKRDGIADIDAHGMALLGEYNRHLLGYGAVETVWPSNQQKPDAHLFEVAPVESCNRCHGEHAIRAPLLRYHHKPVEALLHMKERDDGFVTDADGEHHLTAMPPVAPALPADNSALLDWMAH